MEWSGVEWSGVEWSGVEWSGVEWSVLFAFQFFNNILTIELKYVEGEIYNC